jgi:hypothetical protein
MFIEFSVPKSVNKLGCMWKSLYNVHDVHNLLKKLTIIAKLQINVMNTLFLFTFFFFFFHVPYLCSLMEVIRGLKVKEDLHSVLNGPVTNINL